MKFKRTVILIIILLGISCFAWYGVNYYAAGMVNQTQLIEFGFEEDFLYCNEWRPELLDVKKTISDYHEYYVDENEVTLAGWTLVKAKQVNKFPIFIWSIKYDHELIAKRLIELDEVNINQRLKNKFTALHYACRSGNIKTVKTLIDKDVKVNHADGMWSPLYFAVYHKHKDIINLLLKHGAQMNVRYFPTNSKIRIWNPHTEEKFQNIHFYAMFGDEAYADFKDINLKTNQGNTPLHLSAYIDTTKTLIRHKSDIYAVNDSKKLPIETIGDLASWKYLDNLMDKKDKRLNEKMKSELKNHKHWFIYH